MTPRDLRVNNRPPIQRESSCRHVKLQAWLRALQFVFPWFIPAALAVGLKMSQLGNGRGFRVIARYLGRVEATGYTGLSFSERLTFFRSEMLFAFLLIPLALWLLFRFLPRECSAAISAILSVCFSIVLFVQFRSLAEMGQYISFATLRVGLIWGWHNPGANAGYLLTRDFYVFCAGIFCITVLTWRALRWKCSSSLSPHSMRLWECGVALYALIVILLTVLAWRPLLAATPYHENVLARCLKALWEKQAVGTSAFTSLSDDDLMRKYRELTGAPVPHADPRYVGTERGANVILFLLETTPARFLPSDDTLAQFPNLRRLNQHTWVAEQHYTTYPYTNRAVPSIFSSWYPTDGLNTLSEQHPDVALPGFAPTLRQQGYSTAIYLPASLHGGDVDTFRSLGFDREVFPDPSGLAAFAPKTVDAAWKADRLGRDLAVLKMFEDDLERWLSSRTPFATTFVPQIGHLPWPDTESGTAPSDIERRGRAVVAIQDGWLGEVLDILSRHHQLENTIIVITGDHGIRTRHEDPNFAGGTIDDYSFHVPMRLYAPHAVAERTAIPWLTSHIDLTPTILDLLGVEHDRNREQGAPIWDPDIAKRTTFFFAGQAFGADGYYEEGKFFMWSRMSGAASKNSTMHFDSSSVLPEDSQESRNVVQRMERMLGFDQVWDARLSRTSSANGRASAGH